LFQKKDLKMSYYSHCSSWWSLLNGKV
jgi:hypothetical protein